MTNAETCRLYANVRDGETTPCEHEYETVYEDMEKERLRCAHCGDSYVLYDDEMR